MASAKIREAIQHNSPMATKTVISIKIFIRRVPFEFRLFSALPKAGRSLKIGTTSN
jgi:hypothetical protein